MHIVIDIPKDEYEKISSGKFDITGYFKLNLSDAFRNGIPLPKGHRKLIAEPTDEEIAKTMGGQNDFAECIREAVKAVFDNAQTIIEAEEINDNSTM